MRSTYLDDLNERRLKETERQVRTLVDAVEAVNESIPVLEDMIYELGKALKEVGNAHR